MNKSFLFGCAAAVTLTSTMAFAATETAESVKTAFSRFLSEQTQIGDVLDLNKMKVVADGNDFVVTLPAVDEEDAEGQTRDIRLVAAGEFNGYPQYKVESLFEVMQGMFQSMIPEGKLTTQSIQANMTWVPHYNLVVNNSQNIQGLTVDLPGLVNLTIDSLVSDTLVKVDANNRMDKADSQDAKGISLVTEGVRISLPSVSYTDQINKTEITGNSLLQVLSSEEASSELSVPTVIVLAEGSPEPMATATFDSSASFEDDEADLEMSLTNIVLGQMAQMMLPSAFIPTEVSVELELSGVTAEEMKKFFATIQDESISPEVEQAAIREFTSKAVLTVDPLEIKNAEAGVTVTGTVENRFRDDNTAYPVVNAKVAINNLDKLSPEPTVNQEQCEQTKKQMENVTDAVLAENAIKNACAPHGGMLDKLRPFLNPANRVVNSDGSTTDIIDLIYDNDVLTLNGQVVE